MILELPFTSDAAQIVVVQLDQVKYEFDVRYNDRAATWFMSVTDFATKAPILESVALLIGGDILHPYNLGVGSFIVTDEDGTGLDAGPDELGVRVKVYWLSSDE